MGSWKTSDLMLQFLRDKFSLIRSNVFGLFGLGLLALVPLFYLIAMFIIHDVDDNPDFLPETHEKGESYVVAMTAALIEREVAHHSWTPNDPFFLPGAWLDRMPAFQKGVIGALSRFSLELADQIGRTRGSSRVDADLEKAAGLLKYAPDIWVFDLSTSWMPTASSEKQYLAAMEALRAYNNRLANGEGVFEKRADNLLATLERISADLGSYSASIAAHIERKSGFLPDTEADELYYEVKGRLYAYYLILKELERDFAPIIQEKQLESAWDQMLDSMRIGSQLSLFFVFNAAPDNQLFPNHLDGQGFYLLRARTQLKEISNILLK